MLVPNNGTVLDGVRNPVCGEYHRSPSVPTGKGDCYSENRATLHLHGGITPWISDGTPHQWITPAGENTSYPKGVSVSNVPDMPDPGPGAQTFFYTNQQSARLMFYHDHAWGITRLNVYAGEAAGYLVTDAMEQALIGTGGAMAGLGVGTPLVIQDKTFVPSPAKVAQQDPTWDYARWGGEGSLWAPHVYMPAQNPGDPSGMSSFGRWMYGPWFWPPNTTAPYQPIDNPYFDATCDPNLVLPDGSTQFCEPALIPGTPNISVGHGSLQRHAARQRHGLPHHHGRPEGLPLPDPERGQRPLLEPVVVRRGPADRDAQRGRPEPRRGRGRPDRPGRHPDPRRHAWSPEGPQLDPDRHARAASFPRRSSSRPRPPSGSPTRPGSTWATSTTAP